MIPKNATKSNEKALAYGEVTGHSHSLTGVVGEDFQIFTRDGVKFCELKADRIELRHEEHNPQTLEKADFPNGLKVHIVREYDHFLEEAREVAD